MHQRDIPFAVRLANLEAWGIPTRDFKRILSLDPQGSFVATEGHRRVGLATTTHYGNQIAWIGNVVVKKQYRQRHIGQQLVEHAVSYLQKGRVRHIALYSFKENFRFYRKLGFEQGPRFVRLRREHVSGPGLVVSRLLAEPLTLSSVLALDKRAFGANRRRLITVLLDSGFAWYLGYRIGSSASYMLVKTYDDMIEIGPWVSFGLKSSQLDSLLQLAIGKSGRKPIEIACPLTADSTIGIMNKRNFRAINEGRMMLYGERATIGDPKAIVAFGFLDKG
jgi:GNAT superfamily N-acetyltransferase